jgi:YD repeat-containing protein
MRRLLSRGRSGKRGSRRVAPTRLMPRVEQLEERVLLSLAPQPYLDAIYRDLLNRAPDPAGQTFWTQAIQDGATPSDIARAVAGSPEALQNMVQQDYTTLLRRGADPGGLATFTGALAAGATPVQIEATFLASPEFASVRTDGTDSGFLSAVYSDVLKRQPDAAGVAFFGGQLSSGMPRERVAEEIAGSPEAHQTLVDSWYNTAFGHAADAAGKAFWSAMLDHGAAAAAVEAGVFGSPEFLRVAVGDPVDPLSVVDANKAMVLTPWDTQNLLAPNVAQNDFSSWPVDLRAQVSGGTVSSYSWNLMQAPDATSVSGSSTYRLQFTWASFSGAARDDTISVTATMQDLSLQTATFHFHVLSSSSAAWAATPPSSASTWPAVLSPDLIAPGEAVQSGNNYQLGLHDGAVLTSHALPAYNPNVAPLVFTYNSTAADPRPIFLDRYTLDPGLSEPPTVAAVLTFNGVQASPVYFDTSLLNPGDTMQIALQADATGLATGRYSYSITVTPTMQGAGSTTNSGQIDIINEANSPFGAGWTLDGLDRLIAAPAGAATGVILETYAGHSLWFANGNSQGTFVTPVQDSSVLVQNQNGGYTRTLKDGTAENFTAAGRLSTVVDRNGNTTTYAYNTAGALSSITDMNGLATTLTYSAGGKLLSVADFPTQNGGHVTQFVVNTNGVLATITDADSAVWTYGYDSAGRLTSLTDPRLHAATFTYGLGNRVSGVTRADATTESVTPVQLIGMAAAGTGSSSNPATGRLAVEAVADYTDPRGNHWLTHTDAMGYGVVTQMSDPLGDESVVYRKDCGCPNATNTCAGLFAITFLISSV